MRAIDICYDECRFIASIKLMDNLCTISEHYISLDRFIALACMSMSKNIQIIRHFESCFYSLYIGVCL